MARVKRMATMLLVLAALGLSACGEASVRLTFAAEDGARTSATAVTPVVSEAAAGSAKDGDTKTDEYEHYADLNDLGYKYQLGFEVERDYEKAVECYREAAEYGIPEAVTNLGYCYERGLGVEVDYERAVELYRQGAALGESTAMNNLGWCYERGLGIEQSYATAHEWYSRSAECGNTTGYENMMYLEKNGLVK